MGLLRTCLIGAVLAAGAFWASPAEAQLRFGIGGVDVSVGRGYRGYRRSYYRPYYSRYYNRYYSPYRYYSYRPYWSGYNYYYGYPGYSYYYW